MTIGRQNCWVSPQRLAATFKHFGIAPTPKQQAGIASYTYAEPVLRCLGATQVDSVDNSDYESSTLIWDMNQPIPQEWHGQYDLVYDGWSIEHVFNIQQAIGNYMNLLRVGGHVVITTMANNYSGHGFYQLSPEFFYRCLAPENGFSMRREVVYENYEGSTLYEVPDPATIRSRIELSNRWVGVNIIAMARRDAIVPLFARWPQQSDYQARWNASDLPPAPAEPRNSAKKQMIERAKASLPKLVALKHHILVEHPWLTRAFSRRQARSFHRRFGFTAQPDRFVPAKPSRKG